MEQSKIIDTLETYHPLPIDDSFPDEQLAVINASRTAPWYADLLITLLLNLYLLVVRAYLSPICFGD